MIKRILPIIWYLFGSILLMITVFAFTASRLPPQIPLFYSNAEGDDQLVDTFFIFVIPFLSILFVFTNNWILNKYFFGQVLVEKIIYFTNLFIIIFSAFLFIKIILLVS